MVQAEIRWMRSRDQHADGRRMLRELVSARTGLSPTDVRITATCPDCGGAHGRPVAEGSGLHLSVSYSTGVVVVAVATTPVGVDVEHRAQSHERLDAVLKLTGARSIERWTRTEAVLRADGRGLRVDPAEVTFDGDTASLAGVTYAVSEIAISPELVVSVAVAAGP